MLALASRATGAERAAATSTQEGQWQTALVM